MKLTKARLRQIIKEELDPISRDMQDLGYDRLGWRDSRNPESGMTLHEMVSFCRRWLGGMMSDDLGKFVDAREDEETLRLAYDALEKAEELLK
jgi:hypothetical protein